MIIYDIIFCSCAGCLIRYINLYKLRHTLNFVYLVLDMLVAAFIGYLFSKLYEDIHMSNSVALVTATLLGNAGSRALYILKRMINRSVQFTLFDEDTRNDSTRNKKS